MSSPRNPDREAHKPTSPKADAPAEVREKLDLSQFVWTKADTFSDFEPNYGGDSEEVF